MEKVRLDIAMVQQGIVESREKAKALIMAGKVLVNGKKIEKAGTNINKEATITITGQVLPFVSRGGLKLEKALEVFPIKLKDRVMADIGASTGGFTDCALKKGVGKVYAIDVGYGQLAWQLRNDPRVINMERTNARYLKPENFPDRIDLVTIDVSFISLEKILPAVYEILQEQGDVIALIKPQFEAGREKVGKKGVVKDPQVHLEVINNIIELSKKIGFSVKGLTSSPIKGPEGNIEYLIWLDKTGHNSELETEKVVFEAVQQLNNKG